MPAVRPALPLQRLPLSHLLAVGLWLATTVALAQPYRCSSANGSYYSDRPCPIQGGTQLGNYGPLPEPRQPVQRYPTPVAPPAPEHLVHMSATCASLNDGLRTAASRGLSLQAQSELRQDYNRRCLSDEQRARQHWSQQQSTAQLQRREQQQQANEASRRDAAQQQLARSQCGEMRRIITSKNERIATLTPGEVNDLRRFEGNYAARCQAQTP